MSVGLIAEKGTVAGALGALGVAGAAQAPPVHVWPLPQSLSPFTVQFVPICTDTQNMSVELFSVGQRCPSWQSDVLLHVSVAPAVSPPPPGPGPHWPVSRQWGPVTAPLQSLLVTHLSQIPLMQVRPLLEQSDGWVHLTNACEARGKPMIMNNTALMMNARVLIVAMDLFI